MEDVITTAHIMVDNGVNQPLEPSSNSDVAFVVDNNAAATPTGRNSTADNESIASDGDSIRSRNQGFEGSDGGYKEYPEGDERALPEFILRSNTMDELDSTTGAWEQAIENLPDGEFWRSLVNDLEGLEKRAPLHLAAKIRAGIPSTIRGVVWQTLTKARSTYLQTVYTQLIKEYSPHERVIRRDLTRTFPKIPVFKEEGGEGQQRLFRILKAYSLYDAEVGYCQGLGFIIGPLILSMGECEAFCVLVRLMETFDLRGMFTEDMAGLHLRLYQFQVLAKEIIPEVMNHLELMGVLPAMYAPAWFLSLFAYTMPLSFVLRTMDVLMSEGAPESIIRIGIALLMRNKDQILAMEDFESTMKVLNNELYNDESCLRDRPGFVLQEAAKLSAVVTQQRLEQLEAQYCKEQGVVLKGRQSMSVDDNTSANADSSSVNANGSRSSSNHAIMNFLGWPWGNSNNNSSSASSIASTPHPVSSAAVGSKWKFGNLGKNLATPSNDGEEYSDSIGSEDRSYISPKALELTESQKQYSRQLREQMLQSLLTQDNTPATMLGSISSLQANSSNSRDSADSNTTNTVVTPKRTSLDIELNGDSATPVVSRQKSKSSMDNAWRDEVLEPLQRQLYDARVTCDSHRDALVALQKEHESLQGDLATVKMSYAELAEQNDQLRMMLRKLETERNKHQEEAAYHLERTQRSEEALIRARIDLADADEEKAALKKQISNLRKFVNDTSTSSMPSGTLNQQPPMRSRIMSADSGTLPLLNPAAVANSSNGGNNGNNRQQGRFSISTIASNWSAFRGSIVSPRSSMQQDSAVSSPAVPPSTGGGDDTASLMSVTSASLSPQINRRVSIPLTSLHRSKTVTSVTSNPNAKAPSHLGDQAAVPGGSPSLSSSSSRSPASGTQGDAH